MKKFLGTLAVLFIFFLIPGCIELQTKLTVNNDGSGTLEETVLMSKEMINMLNEFVMGFADDSSQAEEFKLYNEEDLKSRVSEMGEGVNFVSGEEIKLANKEGYKAVYNFSDLSKLKIDQSPDSKIPADNDAAEMKEKKYVTFNFVKGNISEVNIKMPPASEKNSEEEIEETENESEAEADSINDTYLSQMKFFMQDLSISLVMDFKGEITETNADYRDGSSITLFNLNFGELLNNADKLEQFKKINPDNLKELKELMKDIPGIKIETNDPVIVKFR